MFTASFLHSPRGQGGIAVSTQALRPHITPFHQGYGAHVRLGALTPVQYTVLYVLLCRLSSNKQLQHANSTEHGKHLRTLFAVRKLWQDGCSWSSLSGLQLPLVVEHTPQLKAGYQ